MNLIEILAAEHRLIVKASECLEAMIGEAMVSQRLKFLHAESIVDFSRNFTDRWHHAREENLLFPLMAAKNDPETAGRLDDLRKDHERGRACAKAMGDSFRDGAHGDAGETLRFCKSAQEYIDVLRMHIYKEDRVVFPLFEKTLTPGDLRALDEGCAALAVDPGFAGIEAKCQAIVDDLRFIYNIGEGPAG